MITTSFGLTATERVLPKLALDFTTASLDSRVTFTRTTGASNPATYVNSSGAITAATNNQPRFDFNPVTLVCKGLLIEESRRNLFKGSDLSDPTYVAVTNQTVFPGSPNSPLKENINQTDRLKLKYNQNTFSLSISSINYDAPDNVAFYWKLEG